MILVRLRHNNKPEIVFKGSEKDIIHKIQELNLCDQHDSFFYEKDKFENLGLGGNEYDYYAIYENFDEMNNILS
jgi:hypothetical protein